MIGLRRGFRMCVSFLSFFDFVLLIDDDVC